MTAPLFPPLATPGPGHRDDLLIVTPHPSGQMPADVLRDMLGDAAFDTATREALLRRVFNDGDLYTDLLYTLPGARHVQAPWSRFAADLNRRRDDPADNGVLKRTTFDRRPLYPPGFALSPAAEEARLRRLWDPFDALVTAELCGARLMLVGHAMAERGPALGRDVGAVRPALCVMPGTPEAPTFPRQHWPALQAACAEAFAPALPAHLNRVTVGEPWSTDVLSAAHHARSGVPAFGLELNVALYTGPQARPRDDAMRALNAAFARFADAALRLVEHT